MSKFTLFGWGFFLCNVFVKSQTVYYVPEFTVNATENLVSFDKAIQKCEKEGNILANIKSASDQEDAITVCWPYLVEKGILIDGGLGCWIGINNMNNIDEYVYSDSTSVAGNFGFDVNGVPDPNVEAWKPLQPDNDDHRCLSLINDGTNQRDERFWNDVNCNSTLFVPLCEKVPTSQPTTTPTETPIITPSITPTQIPSNSPTENPIIVPTISPSTTPTSGPIKYPTTSPSILPSVSPTPMSETDTPTASPLTTTNSPTNTPTIIPTISPIISTTINITNITPIITYSPSQNPSQNPTLSPDNDSNPPNPQNAKKGVDNTKTTLLLVLIVLTIVLLCLAVAMVLFIVYKRQEEKDEAPKPIAIPQTSPIQQSIEYGNPYDGLANTSPVTGEGGNSQHVCTILYIISIYIHKRFQSEHKHKHLYFILISHI